jgi:ribosomal protein S18 acetylase RimI-like enzyme
MDMKMKLYATDLKKTYFSTDASKKEKILVCSMKEENHNPAIGSRYCGFIKYNQRSRGKSSSVDGCINGLAVHKNYRKQGIAQLLLSACENDYKNNSDLRQLQLTVFTSNRDAIKLYKKYGFSVAIEDCISVDMIKLI